MPKIMSENVHPRTNMTESSYSNVVDRKLVILSTSMTEKMTQILFGFEPASFAIVGISDLKMIIPKRIVKTITVTIL